MGFVGGVRRILFGSRGAFGSTVSSVLRETSRIPPGDLGQVLGPFDEPPEEPVELGASEIPWELRDAPDSSSSDPAR